MVKKTLAVAVFLLIFAPRYASAVQFEDYVWGTPLDKAKEVAEKKGKTIRELKYTSSIIICTYADIIWGKPCDVSMYFTPKSKLLAAVTLRWSTTAFKDDLLMELRKKYGDYKQKVKGVSPEFYMWHYWRSKYEGMVLDCRFNYAKLYFYGGRYMERLKEESGQTKDIGLDAQDELEKISS